LVGRGIFLTYFLKYLFVRDFEPLPTSEPNTGRESEFGRYNILSARFDRMHECPMLPLSFSRIELAASGIGARFRRVLRHGRTPRSLPGLFWKNIKYAFVFQNMYLPPDARAFGTNSVVVFPTASDTKRRWHATIMRWQSGATFRKYGPIAAERWKISIAWKRPRQAYARHCA
jgi:hypothetical protein